MSSEKEKEYLELFKGGDIEARDILVKHNLRLVAYIAKKYTNYPDQDELVSVGTLGLIKAINSYKDDRGTQLATYASRCIENEILMAMRGYKKMQGNVSLYENVGRDREGNDMMLIDMLSIDEETVYNQLETEMLRVNLMNVINKYLTAREKTIIMHRFGLKDGNIMTQQEVSNLLGISRSYVSRIEKSTLNKLKKAIAQENLQL